MVFGFISYETFDTDTYNVIVSDKWRDVQLKKYFFLWSCIGNDTKIEAIQIKLVRKGSPGPTNTTKPYVTGKWEGSSYINYFGNPQKISLIILEVLTLFVEGFVYSKVLKYKKINPYLISLILNCSSYFLGELVNHIF